jgi:FkbM family methyltransferase
MSASALAKVCARAVVGAIPPVLARAALRAAALFPPALKTPLFQRICAAIARRHRAEERSSITTNLGISSDLRCGLPYEKFAHAFGRPSNNISERSTLEIIRILSKDCAHFIDVGANEGLFTILVAKTGNKETNLHWFEPDGDLYARVTDNLSHNGIAASGNKMAVCNSTGHRVFHKNLTDDSSGSLSDHFSGKHETLDIVVDTTSLSDYMSKKDIDGALVKVDVEGGGSDVWAGTALAARKIKFLVMEMLAPEIDARLPARIADETGWYAYYMRDFDLVPAPGGRFNYVDPFWNWFFCTMAPDDLAKRLANTKFRVVASG